MATMTKKQKIWLWVFIAMFAVPEILWSPVVNFIYSFFNPLKNGRPQLLRNSFLFDYKYENLLKLIIFIQTIGIIIFFIFWLKNKTNINTKIIFWGVFTVSLLVCLVVLFVFYLAVIFNPVFP